MPQEYAEPTNAQNIGIQTLEHEILVVYNAILRRRYLQQLLNGQSTDNRDHIR